MATALDPRIYAALGPTYSGQANQLSAQLIAPDGTVLQAGLTFVEAFTGTGLYRVSTPTDSSVAATAYYTWTGTPAIPWLAPDVLTPRGVAATLDLAQSIPVSPAPTVGTVGEALAAARAYAIGNESKSGNVVTLHASDDTTVLDALTYAPSITTPTSRTRS